MDHEPTQSFIVVTDFVPANCGKDVSEAIQNIIDTHPNRTIFFPDGEYLLAKPILTPANPRTSVSLRLSEYACLRADASFPKGEALVQLGAKDPANDIVTVGSNYALEGGEIDGSGFASGVSINGGRETAVRNVSIKHTQIGLHILRGANSGSSDCDIFGVNIVGNGAGDAVGVLLEGFDNTLTNMRIAKVHTGVLLRSGGNCLRNIHPLFTGNFDFYPDSVGFRDESSGDNWYFFCYSDQFETGFYLADDIVSQFDRCFVFWYTERGGVETAVRAATGFQSVFTNLDIGFCGTSTDNAVLRVGKDGGCGEFERLILKPEKVNDKTHLPYLTGKIIPRKY